jgi:hypothetical protein
LQKIVVTNSCKYIKTQNKTKLKNTKHANVPNAVHMLADEEARIVCCQNAEAVQ